MNVNIDVHRRLHVTKEAEAYLVDQRPAVVAAR